MDTGTHVAMGVALGGLATLDPVVSNDSTLFTAVMVGTLIGSQAPDFDTVLKLKDNAAYIRHHRGMSHSIPAIIFWGILIAKTIHLFFPHVNFFHLWLWTFLAVIIHVFVDLFNSYGTQALLPFSKKWIAFGFINTFDPYIFLLHVAGIVAWVLGAHPGYTWLIIYSVIILYYVKRFLDKREIVTKINEHFPHTETIVTSPTIKQNVWRIAITTTDKFYVGVVENGHIQILEQFKRVSLPDTPLFKCAIKDYNISAFLSFSPVYRWEMTTYDKFSEIRFIDLRYRSKGRYPFVAVVQIDQHMNVINSYTGWVFSEQTLQNKLHFGGSPI